MFMETPLEFWLESDEASELWSSENIKVSMAIKKSKW